MKKIIDEKNKENVVEGENTFLSKNIQEIFSQIQKKSNQKNYLSKENIEKKIIDLEKLEKNELLGTMLKLSVDKQTIQSKFNNLNKDKILNYTKKLLEFQERKGSYCINEHDREYIKETKQSLEKMKSMLIQDILQRERLVKELINKHNKNYSRTTTKQNSEKEDLKSIEKISTNCCSMNIEDGVVKNSNDKYQSGQDDVEMSSKRKIENNENKENGLNHEEEEINKLDNKTELNNEKIKEKNSYEKYSKEDNILIN